MHCDVTSMTTAIVCTAASAPTIFLNFTLILWVPPPQKKRKKNGLIKEILVELKIEDQGGTHSGQELNYKIATEISCFCDLQVTT